MPFSEYSDNFNATNTSHAQFIFIWNLFLNRNALIEYSRSAIVEDGCISKWGLANGRMAKSIKLLKIMFVLITVIKRPGNNWIIQLAGEKTEREMGTNARDGDGANEILHILNSFGLYRSQFLDREWTFCVRVCVHNCRCRLASICTYYFR